MATASASVLVIEAQEMENAVDDQMRHMRVDRPAHCRSLRARRLERHDDVAEQKRNAWLTQYPGVVALERQHVGR